MLFNSYEFIFLFLPLTFVIWNLLCRARKTAVALLGLLVSSLFFYCYWNPPYLFLLIASIAINFLIQHNIAKSKFQKRAKTFLIIGITINLLLVGYFKYFNFFIDNIALFYGVLWNYREIFLPLGISFFTFQQIACLMDTYKGKIGIMPFYKYALFVSFFPQLIAGPIVLADTLIPQFDSKRTYCFSWKNVCIGITMFSIGLFKKVIIADTFSPWTGIAFSAVHPLTFIEAWGGTLAYTFQIYFDFSGYSDMALGLGRLFNITLPVNFNSPYKATSIIDFWRRWHITLSHFLRDYLYIPLGGNRKGKTRRYVNLLLTMLLGGLWHGAGWTFVVWGVLHGAYLTINHLWREHNLFKIPAPVGWIMTCCSVVLAWVFFRAENLRQAISILKGMAGLNGFIIPQSYMPKSLEVIAMNLNITVGTPTTWTFAGSKEIFCIITSILMCKFLPNTYEWVFKRDWTSKQWLSALAVGIMFVSAALSLNNVTEFLYFQF